MTTPTAEVVETKEPERYEFGEVFVVHEHGPQGQPRFLWFQSQAEAEKAVLLLVRCRILRLPSEREAALQPLRDAVNRAAVELAENHITPRFAEGVLVAAFRAAVGALAAAEAAQGEKP